MVFPGLLTFFLSNITLVHCGRQSFFKMDCQELQLVVYVAMFVTGILGTSFWQEVTIPIPECISFSSRTKAHSPNYNHT